GVQAAGVSVAQRGVVAAEEGEAVGKLIFGAVREAVFGAAGDDADVDQVRQEAVPRDLAEADHDAQARQSGNLGGEMRGAVADLLWSGLVAGRGAADD